MGKREKLAGSLSCGDALFEATMRGAKPLRQRAPETNTKSVRNLEKNLDVIQASVGPRRRQPELPLEQPSDGLDKRTANRLRRGQMRIEGCLDLHGNTQVEAHHAVHAFITNSQRMGRRCVLIITGKGSLRKNMDLGFMPDRDIGVLRRNLPHWLAESPVNAMVLQVEPARPQHGGDGAFYVLLRRRR